MVPVSTVSFFAIIQLSPSLFGFRSRSSFGARRSPFRRLFFFLQARLLFFSLDALDLELAEDAFSYLLLAGASSTRINSILRFSKSHRISLTLTGVPNL